MNPKLQQAVSLFKTLGWEDVTLQNILQLPLGTADQKRTALAGLKSGEWGEFAQTRKNTFGWRSHIAVEEGKLALFAVRMGVDARRAVSILHSADSEMLLAVIAERGAKYASDFTGHVCRSRRSMFEHSASLYGSVLVKLVDRLDLDIPQNVGYLKDWSVYAAAAMGFKAEILRGETGLPGLEMIQRRFADHISTGVAVNTPATGPFGVVLPAGVKRGWLPREKAVALTFSALDAAVRPGDRKVWLNVLDQLDISDNELCAHTQALVPLLATGDSAVITRLAPVLIAQTDDSVLSEVLLAAFSATTKKAKQLVLKSALTRQRPQNAEELAPWLWMLAGDADKTIASRTALLIKQWGISGEILPDETAPLQNLWKKTPPVWQLPPFEMGEVSPEALTELAAMMVRRPAVVHDVATERFWAVANAVAYQNPQAARTSLGGLRTDERPLHYAVCWVKGETPHYGHDETDRIEPVLAARNYMACLHLDKLPCLLSTPSMADLSIRIPDLAARLALYEETGTDALEADLFLALTRLDGKTQTPETIKALRELHVPIVLQSGEHLPITAGQMVLAYMDDPVKEPPMVMSNYGYLRTADIILPDSLHGFPNRFSWHWPELFSVFPLWEDAALHNVRWSSEVYHEQGLILRQVARRASPLPPGAATNLLAAQRSMTPDAAEDSMLAVTEAWERGLLPPGAADIVWLDWSGGPPANLAALASALDSIARDGMLSVVWPMVDALIGESLKAPRLLAGTAELAQLMAEFLPEVEFAVDQGISDKASLALPGIRALAQRGGSSRAVSAAQKVASLLPPEPAAPEQEPSDPIMDPPFDQVWPVYKEISPPIEDGVSLTVDWANPSAPTKLFLFTLTLPGIPDRVFQVVNRGWYYALESEGQCLAYSAAPDAAFTGDQADQVWLHWDAEQKAMVVCDKRNWAEGKDGSLQGIQAPPLSSSLLTVVVGLLAQDGDAIYSAPRLLQKLTQNGLIGQDFIHKATRTLLQNPVVSPAKLVRMLEKDLQQLHVLWPMLTECIKFAGALVAAGNPPPVWVNRILDIALRHAPYLKEAAQRGLIPAEDAQWLGLSEIASSKAKSVAVAKARKLLAALG